MPTTLVGAAEPETPLTTLRRETRNLLVQEASEKDASAKESAAAALCDLYVVIRSDPRFETSEMLKGDAAKIRRRLIKIATQRENRLKRAGTPRPEALSDKVQDSIDRALDGTDSAQTQHEESGDSNGGFAGAPLGANPWELVELIQRVVAPDLWDAQGGPATIQYFAMRRVLVVRATTDVHEQVRDLLTALR